MTELPHPTLPAPPARGTYRFAPLLRPNALCRRVAAWLERSPRALRPFTTVERRSKEILITPNCGLRHVPVHAARAKMRAMTTAAAAVRGRIQKEKNT